MMKRYIYEEGDTVYHQEHDEGIKGIIVQKVTCCLEGGDRILKEDIENPWYLIQWEGWDEGEYGFEHQCQLVPEWFNTSPGRFMTHVWRTDKPLWDKIVNIINPK